MPVQQPRTALDTTNLADLLERVLDKGIMIAGDIKINICDIELLTIQIRLVICSVDKAQEMGMDWWANNPAFCSRRLNAESTESLDRIDQRLERLEAALAGKAG